VRALQSALIRNGIAVPGGADGIFGPKTAQAVTEYQRRHGLPTTGVVDTLTAQLLGLVPAPDLPARGQRGDHVRRLQQALVAAGITVRGGADGIFGSGTATAVADFQRARGLPATGVVDLRTALALGLLTSGNTPAVVPPGTTTTRPPTSTTTASTTTSTTTAPTTTAPTSASLPRQGDRGDAVRALQSALIRNGIAVPGGADGIFGPKTAQAVTEYQRRHGLPATGVVDTLTAQLLGLVPAPDLPARGQRGDHVRRLQQALVAAGITVRGGVDGIFGSGTATAVADFQRARGLPATGVVDLRTALALGLLTSGATPGPGPTTPPPTTPTTTPTTPTTPTTTPTTTTVPAPDPATLLKVFPMQGWCAFTDTWGAPRSGGRAHEGVDIIGAAGKLIYAATDGTITKLVYDTPGSLGGNNLRLTMDDGSNTYFYYAHLSGFAEGIKVGTKVKAGQILGYNGATGNAATPHLHFEVHPGGGRAINPYPYVKAVDACNVTTPRPQP
jgi:peptidoglycan hydrolase-like protein with peptidoglycan-binding domain